MRRLSMRELKELKDGTIVLVQTKYAESTREIHVLRKKYTSKQEDVLIDIFSDYWIINSSALKDDIEVYMN